MASQHLGRRGWRGPLAACALTALASSAIAGCSSASSGGTPGGGATGSASSGSLVLTLEDYYTSGSANTFWAKAVAEYHQLHPEITIHREVAPNPNYGTHLMNEAAAGALPDIVMMDNVDVPRFAAAGVLAPLRQVGPIDTSGMTSGLVQNGMYNGTLYAIQPYANTIALAYNKDMFAAAHLSPPRTWADLVSDAKRLTTSNVYGFVSALPAVEGSAFWTFSPFLWTSAGAAAVQHISSPQSIAAANLIVQLVRNGSLPKTCVSWNNDEDVEYFQTGKAAMLINGSWQIPTFDAVKNLHYGTVQIPTPAAGQHPLVPIGGETYAIAKSGSAAQQQAALAFLRWLITPQEDAKAALGVGGMIPSVRAAVPLVLPQENPAQMQPYATELENGATPRTQYTGPTFNTVATTIGNALDAAIVGQSTAQQAFAGIAAKVTSELHGGS